MIRIGICDDQPKQIEKIKRICEEYSKKQDMNCEYVLFSSGEKVLEYNREFIHLLFLDIEMEKIDGITVMKQLEQRENVWRIVFVSNHDDAVWETFGIKTLGFVRKPVIYNTITKYIEIALKECKENTTISFNKNDPRTYVKLNSLLYIKGDATYVYVYTINENFIASGNLKKWENELENTPILRVHKSYMVNMENIKKIDNEIFLRFNDFKIPIGRKYKKVIKEVYNNYLINRLQRRI